MANANAEQHEEVKAGDVDIADADASYLNLEDETFYDLRTVAQRVNAPLIPPAKSASPSKLGKRSHRDEPADRSHLKRSCRKTGLETSVPQPQLSTTPAKSGPKSKPQSAESKRMTRSTTKEL